MFYAAGLLPIDKKMEADLLTAYRAGNRYKICGDKSVVRNYIILKSKLNDYLNEARQDFRKKPLLGERRTFLPDEIFS
jgi:hypothetical protein